MSFSSQSCHSNRHHSTEADGCSFLGRVLKLYLFVVTCIRQIFMSVYWKVKNPSCFYFASKPKRNVPGERGNLLSAREEITSEPSRSSNSNAPLGRRGPARWMLGTMLRDGTAPSSVPAARRVPLWQDQRLTPERAKTCRTGVQGH